MPRKRNRSRGVTLTDVARLADVHVSTASRALNSPHAFRISRATVDRVEAAAAHLGYTPDLIAQGLKRGTTTTVGVIVPDLANPFFVPLIRALSQQIESRSYVTLVAETLESRERFERTLDNLLGRRVDAAVIAAAKTGDRDLLRRFADRVPACVLAVRDVEASGLPHVTQDDRQGGELAGRHLAELGHTVLAELHGPADIATFAKRSEGFRRALGTFGRIDVSTGERAAGLTLAEGERLMRLAFDRNPARAPTAVFAHADPLAIGAVLEIRRRGLRCPEDVSVIGYDDAPLVDQIDPPLSTIALPGDAIGRHAGQLVLALLDDPDARPAPVSLPARLIVRGSTAPPPRAPG